MTKAQRLLFEKAARLGLAWYRGTADDADRLFRIREASPERWRYVPEPEPVTVSE